MALKIVIVRQNNTSDVVMLQCLFDNGWRIVESNVLHGNNYSSASAVGEVQYILQDRTHHNSI
jgi:hypothetical protein